MTWRPVRTAAVVVLVGWTAVSLAESPARIDPRGEPAARAAVAELRVIRSAPQRVGVGSGFFVSRDGRLVTNWHVVREAVTITARTARGETLAAVVLVEDPDRDLVVLQVTGHDFPSLELADTGGAVPGEPITLIAAGQTPCREGRTGAIRELFGQPMLAITTPLVPGDSGSPLVNTQGRVVGMANGQFPGGTPEQNKNFAVPVASIRRVLAQFAAVAAPPP